MILSLYKPYTLTSVAVISQKYKNSDSINLLKTFRDLAIADFDLGAQWTPMLRSYGRIVGLVVSFEPVGKVKGLDQMDLICNQKEIIHVY